MICNCFTGIFFVIYWICDMFIGNLGLFKGFPYYPDLLIVCWCFSLFKCLSLYFGVLGVIGQRKLSVFFLRFSWASL